MYKKLLKKWQKILKLRDFDIALKIRSYKEMSSDDKFYLGRIEYSHEDRFAVIELLDVKHYKKAKKGFAFSELIDLETTIVHELLHLSFIGMNDYNELYTEQQINHIAKLLVDAYKE